jgi:hypothetical protein
VEVEVAPNLEEHLVWVVLEVEVLPLLLVQAEALRVFLELQIPAAVVVLEVVLILQLTQAAQAAQA